MGFTAEVLSVLLETRHRRPPRTSDGLSGLSRRPLGRFRGALFPDPAPAVDADTWLDLIDYVTTLPERDYRIVYGVLEGRTYREIEAQLRVGQATIARVLYSLRKALS